MILNIVLKVTFQGFGCFGGGKGGDNKKLIAQTQMTELDQLI